MDCETRARTWNFLVLIQDCSIAAIMTAVLALLLRIHTLVELSAIFALCYITVRMYYRVTWTFFEAHGDSSNHAETLRITPGILDV